MSSLIHQSCCPTAPHREVVPSGCRTAFSLLSERAPSGPECCGNEGGKRLEPSQKGYINPNGSVDFEASPEKPQQISEPLLFIRFSLNKRAVIAVGSPGQEAGSCLRTSLQCKCQAPGSLLTMKAGESWFFFQNWCLCVQRLQ